MMYNLKFGCDQLLKKLRKEGFKAVYIGEYPFHKVYNSKHQERIRDSEIQFVTDATLDKLKEMFDVIEVKDSFEKQCVIQTELKQNLLNFTCFYKDDYVSKVTGDVFKVKNFNDILRNRNFYQDTVTIDEHGITKNHPDKDVFEYIISGNVDTQAPLLDTIKKDPMCIFQLLYKTCSSPFVIQDYQKDIIRENYDYLKYESRKNIINAFKGLISCEKPEIFINFIKETMINFKYENDELFSFLNYLKEETINNLHKLDRDDIIARWSYMLKDCPKEIIEYVIKLYSLDKSRITWLIDHYDLPKSNDYKTDIYKAIPSLEIIKDRKACIVFKLYDMLQKLKMIYSALDPDNSEKYNKLLWLVCSRPFDKKQLLYDDLNILRILDLKIDYTDENELIKPEWLEDYKQRLVEVILYQDRHPDENKYLSLMRQLYKDEFANA